jgi:hypothetical protein
MSFKSNLAIQGRFEPGMSVVPASLSADVETDLRMLEVRLMGHTNRLLALGLSRPTEEAELLLRELRRVMDELHVSLS